jgi:hypothetical protein
MWGKKKEEESRRPVSIMDVVTGLDKVRTLTEHLRDYYDPPLGYMDLYTRRKCTNLDRVRAKYEYLPLPTTLEKIVEDSKDYITQLKARLSTLEKELSRAEKKPRLVKVEQHEDKESSCYGQYFPVVICDSTHNQTLHKRYTRHVTVNDTLSDWVDVGVGPHYWSTDIEKVEIAAEKGKTVHRSLVRYEGFDTEEEAVLAAYKYLKENANG